MASSSGESVEAVEDVEGAEVDEDAEDFEDVEDVEWKVLHLKPSEWPTGKEVAPEGYVFERSPFDSALDGYFKIKQSELWNSMRNYRRCQVESQIYSNDDYVFVNYTQDEAGAEANSPVINPKDFWVAKILEIKAISYSLVYARVVWLYWPEDLPMSLDFLKTAKGRRAYHGEHELIASNYMNIINVCTFAGIPLVEQWMERDDEMVLNGLYWRQLFDVCMKQLSKLRPYCICSDNYNPDKLVLACPSCKVWLHEDCIVAATLRQKYQSVTPTYDAIATPDERPKKRKRRGGRPKRSAWVGLFAGQLIQSEDGQPPQVEVTDVRPSTEGEVKCKSDILCMSCGTKLE